MNDQRNHTFEFPLGLVLAKWENLVRKIDPATHIFIQKIVRDYARDLLLKNEVDGLRQLITPAIVRSREEQILFKSIFQEVYRKFSFEDEAETLELLGETELPAFTLKEHLILFFIQTRKFFYWLFFPIRRLIRKYIFKRSTSEEQAPENPIRKKVRNHEERQRNILKSNNKTWKKIRPVIYLFIFLTLGFAFVWPLVNQNNDSKRYRKDHPRGPHSPRVHDGDVMELPFRPDVRPKPIRLPEPRLTVRRDKLTYQRFQRNIHPNYTYISGFNAVDTNNYIVFTPRLRYPLQEGFTPNDFKVNWDFGDGSSADNLFPEKKFRQAGLYPVEYSYELSGTRTPIYSEEGEVLFFIPAKNFNISDFVSLGTKYITKQQNQVKLRIFLIAFFTILLAEGGINFLKNQFLNFTFKLEFNSGKNGPYSLPFQRHTGLSGNESKLSELAQRLKYRTHLASKKLNLPKTIQQTIQTGGLPKLVYTSNTKQVEYVFLIDESSQYDIQTAVFSELVQYLEKEDVPLVKYTFRNYPNRCYNEYFSDGIEFKKITQSYLHAKLMIFSKGTFFLDPFTKEINPRIKEIFEAWDEITLLTPVPFSDWGLREDCLKKYFKLLPADISSQLQMTNLESSQQFFEQNHSGSVSRFDSFDFEKSGDVLQYLGPNLYDWLSASMAYPEPRWEILLSIGLQMDNAEERHKENFIQYGNFGLSASKSQLVTFNNLLKIARIPWIEQGFFPDNIRYDALENLDPELETLARSTILDLLADIHLDENAFASKEKTLQTTVQKALLKPEDELFQRKLRYLWLNDMLDPYLSEKFRRNFFWKAQLKRIEDNFQLKASILVVSCFAIISFFAVRYSNSTALNTLTRHASPIPVSESVIENYQEHFDPFPDFIKHYKAKDYTQALSYSFSVDSIPNNKALLEATYLLNAQLLNKDIDVAKQTLNTILPYVVDSTIAVNDDLRDLYRWHDALITLALKGKVEALEKLERFPEHNGFLFREKAQVLTRDLEKPWYR
ncbi:MAG: hypothetical protein AAF927_03665 [Bacteroidota bacterium]